MLNLFLLFMLGCIGVFPMHLYAAIPPISHAEYFDKYLQPVTAFLEKHEFKGPIGLIMARRALGRQTLEDGLSKPPTYSIAGISKGGFNSSIAAEVLKDFDLKVGLIRDSQGDGPFFTFQGEHANIASALIIAKLFNFYVDKFFKRDYSKKWFMAKETSKAIHQNPDSFELNHRFYVKLQPEKMVEKSCSIYGPGKANVDTILTRSIKRKPDENL
jgi:hypothetical protein